jgi:hypothetical protein
VLDPRAKQGGLVSAQTLIVLIVAILFLGLIWRVLKGAFRLVFTIGILLLIGYVLLNVLRPG